MAVAEIIGLLVRQLSAFDEVERVVLFGSRARGDAVRGSDIDLAVAGPGLSDENWTRMRLLVEDAPTLLTVDLVRLEESDTVLRENILREGKMLYERKSDQPES